MQKIMLPACHHSLINLSQKDYHRNDNPKVIDTHNKEALLVLYLGIAK